MRKHLYLIKKAKIKSWLKFWLLTKDQVKYILSEILEGFSFNLQNTVKKRFKIFNIFGNSVQDGTPTPSNPVEIESVADDVNLFDVGTISDYRNFYNDGDVANWFSINSNILNVIIQDSGATMFYNKKQYKGNENYTIKLKSSMVGNRIYIKLRNANNTDWLTNSDVTISNMTYNSYYKGWFYQSSILNTTLTISVPNCLYCCIGFGFASDSVGTTQTISDIKIQKGTEVTPYSPYNQGTVTIKQRGKNLSDYVLKPQLEKGSKATSYEPYQANDFTFQTEPLRSLPNGVRDSLEADGIHRRVGRVVFDGTENWTSYTVLQNNIAQGGITLSPKAKSRIGYCNNFPVVADYSSTEHIVIAGGFTAVYIHIDQTRLNTQDLAGFKEWLSNNPVTLQYELAEEIIEPYTEEQQEQYNKIKELYTFDGTTNISSTDVVPPYLQIQYYMKGE